MKLQRRNKISIRSLQDLVTFVSLAKENMEALACSYYTIFYTTVIIILHTTARSRIALDTFSDLKQQMLKKLHHQSRSLLFKTGRKDWPYLVQVILLFLLIGYPIYRESVIPVEVTAFNILFVLFILYGIILLEKPNTLLLLSGFGSILILLFKIAGNETESSPWLLRAESILPILYFILLGVRLVKDTLAEEVSIKLLYISITNYFSIGILFSFVFELIHIGNLQAFNFSPEIKYNYLYMSFVILSSAGLGDMLPVSPAAKSAVVMESISGQIYLTFFVAIIIGKYLAEYSQNS